MAPLLGGEVGDLSLWDRSLQGGATCHFWSCQFGTGHCRAGRPTTFGPVTLWQATAGLSDLPLLAQPLLSVYKRLHSAAGQLGEWGSESRVEIGFTVGTRMYSVWVSGWADDSWDWDSDSGCCEHLSLEHVLRLFWLFDVQECYFVSFVSLWINESCCINFVGNYILWDVGCDPPSSRWEGRAAAASAAAVASCYIILSSRTP